jgi:sulfatase modifying factor 1
MVYVPGGRTRIGDERFAAERPTFTASVGPFFMDAHPVTVGEFRRFVDATGYRTDAERLGGGVYDPATDRWSIVAGAVWHRPLGPDGPASPNDHPVTQVSWHDAVAYARWAGKRLPTEVEWEHAARGGRDLRQRYAWGDSLVSGGTHHANTWQAPHPADGYVLTSPVGTYGTSVLGLADMGGNVWEWTADWHRPYGDRGAAFTPDSTSERVQRGGSFLCREDYCHGYRVSARSGTTPETSLFHSGFRLARDLPARTPSR